MDQITKPEDSEQEDDDIEAEKLAEDLIVAAEMEKGKNEAPKVVTQKEGSEVSAKQTSKKRNKGGKKS